jgi:pilus assembly protein CpaE
MNGALFASLISAAGMMAGMLPVARRLATAGQYAEEPAPDESAAEPDLHDKNGEAAGKDLSNPSESAARSLSRTDQDGNGELADENAAFGNGGTPGRVIVFMHVTGGAGATTLAVNTASALNEASPQSCCIIDLDVQFGGVASLLDLTCTSALQALIDDPRRIERLRFEQMLVAHATGLHVLTAPRAPVPLHAFQPQTISSLLDAARARFRFVVVDLPVSLASWTDVVLGVAAQIYLVTPMSVPAAHNLARLLLLLRQHDLTHLPIRVVVNREVKAGRNGALDAAQFKMAIGRSIDHRIPEDYSLIQQSHNQGTAAVRLAPKSRFAQAIGEIAAAESGGLLLAKPQRGLFGRL